MKRHRALILAIFLYLLLPVTSTIAQTAEDYFDRAKAAYDKGDWNAAIDGYTRSIQLRPDDSNAYANRGAAYAEKEDFQSSLRDCEKPAHLNQTNETAYLNRG